MIIESPLDIIFRDLFYRLRSFARGHDVFLKLEGFNVSGSIKVKTAIGLIEDLERRGIGRPHETVIVESSSGNLGIALSLVCAIKGYKFICVTDSNSTRANIRGMELYGATVLVGRCLERDSFDAHFAAGQSAADMSKSGCERDELPAVLSGTEYSEFSSELSPAHHGTVQLDASRHPLYA